MDSIRHQLGRLFRLTLSLAERTLTVVSSSAWRRFPTMLIFSGRVLDPPSTVHRISNREVVGGGTRMSLGVKQPLKPPLGTPRR